MGAGAIAATFLCVFAMAALTLVVVRTVREGDGPTARHYANLALPFGLVPVVAALAVAGPRAALGAAVLVLVLQVVTSAVESHVVARVALQRGDVSTRERERRH